MTNVETPADDSEEIDQEDAAKELEAARSAAKLRQALQRVTLKGNPTYAVGPALLGLSHATFSGAGISKLGGDIGTVGRLLVAFERVLEAVDADLIMTLLHFGNSVTIDMLPVVTDEQRKQIERLAHERPDEPVHVEHLKVVVPKPVLALETAAYIMSAPPSQVAARAGILGAGARNELRKLSVELDRQQATLQLLTPAHVEPVVITRPRAKAYAERLKQTDALEPVEITVRGRLTRTDSEVAEFRVVLDKRAMPPELHGSRKAIEGGYSSKANRQVRDGSLWDSVVVAKVRMTLVRSAGGGRPRPDRFTFTDIRPAYEA